MPKEIKGIFPPSRQATINYDYFDIAEGVGYIVYYGIHGPTGTNPFRVSTSSALYSRAIATYLLNQEMTASLVKYFDYDFDITFNMPKNIKGVILANIPIGAAATDTTTKTVTFQAKLQVVHWDGTTPTVLATGSSTSVVTNIQTDQKSFASTIALCAADVTTLKHFKKGETLRLIVEGWYSCSGGDLKAHLLIGHDPKNRNYKDGVVPQIASSDLALANEVIGGGTVNYQNTQMIFHVPFVLDI